MVSIKKVKRKVKDILGLPYIFQSIEGTWEAIDRDAYPVMIGQVLECRNTTRDEAEKLMERFEEEQNK